MSKVDQALHAINALTLSPDELETLALRLIMLLNQQGKRIAITTNGLVMRDYERGWNVAKNYFSGQIITERALEEFISAIREVVAVTAVLKGYGDTRALKGYLLSVKGRIADKGTTFDHYVNKYIPGYSDSPAMQKMTTIAYTLIDAISEATEPGRNTAGLTDYIYNVCDQLQILNLVEFDRLVDQVKANINRGGQDEKGYTRVIAEYAQNYIEVNGKKHIRWHDIAIDFVNQVKQTYDPDPDYVEAVDRIEKKAYGNRGEYVRNIHRRYFGEKQGG